MLDTYGDGGAPFTRTMPFDKLNGLISAAEVEAKRIAGLLLEAGMASVSLSPTPPAQCLENARKKIYTLRTFLLVAICDFGYSRAQF